MCLISSGLIGICILDWPDYENGVEGSIIIVDDDGFGHYTKIQDAIDNATNGDTIYVMDGYYRETLWITFNIKLIGNGSANTTVDGGNTWFSVIEVMADDVEVTGFTFKNSLGSGVAISSVNNVSFYDNVVKNHYYGFSIYNSYNVTIENNTICRNDFTGVYIWDSSYVTIKNNEIYKNEVGVYLDWSQYCNITSNTFRKCGISFYGWTSGHWTTHFIDDKNTLNNKPIIYWKFRKSGIVPAGAGQVILAKCSKVILQNQYCNNGTSGLLIGHSDNLTIQNNVCNYNNYMGLEIQNSENLTINDNDFNFNDLFGFASLESSNNDFIKNNCSNNNESGILIMMDSNKNFLQNNTCLYNNYSGLSTYFCNNNTFEGNNFSNNARGILMEWESNYNYFIENIISFNSNVGIESKGQTHVNYIYHNNFIQNPIQVRETQSSNYYSKDQEGNYWSDYTGEDNGANGRYKGDGIGDTNIPHPASGKDNYPFMKPYGWYDPGEPFLYEPGHIDNDGNFTIDWENNPRVIGFILEEDESESFESPTEVFSGFGGYYEISNKPEGIYYYRLKLYNQYSYSDWSNTVNITVDFLPRVPIDFQATVNSMGNTIELNWEMNTGDTTSYELFYKTDDMFEFKLLANLTQPICTYIHSGLVDGEMYYYKIRAKDIYWQDSAFSEIISAIPKDSEPPAAPTGLLAVPISDTEIELSWEANSEVDLEGYKIYMLDPTAQAASGSKGEFKEIKTIKNQKTTYTVTKLSEQVTYQFKITAFDEVPNYSEFSETINATTPDETRPHPPTSLKVSKPTFNTLTLKWSASIDSDVIGYLIYRGFSLTGEFEQVNPELVNTTEFVDFGLDEDTNYYYKLMSVDDGNLTSLFSESTFGRTKFGPRAPEINNSIDDFELEEDSRDEISINMHFWFKDLNNDPLTFRCSGQKHINVTIFQENGTVILVPDKDWNGQEKLTFYANDSVFETFEYITITVTGVNDPHGIPVILEPKDNIEIVQGTTINFRGKCIDPDIPFGEVLEFVWYSSIDKELGTGQNLTDVILSPGEHIIYLKVRDNSGRLTKTSVNVTVLEKKSSDYGAGDSNKALILATGVIIIILIILIVIFLLSRRKKNKGKDKENMESKEDKEGKESKEGKEGKKVKECKEGIQNHMPNKNFNTPNLPDNNQQVNQIYSNLSMPLPNSYHIPMAIPLYQLPPGNSTYNNSQ